MRFAQSLTTVAVAIPLLSGCARRDEARLTARYPQARLLVLAGSSFMRSGGGFVPVDPAEADPVKAVEASLMRRGGLHIQLPERGTDAARMTLPGGLAVEVRERGLIGRARKAGGALAYPRAGGNPTGRSLARGLRSR